MAASLRSWWTCTLPACLKPNPPRGRQLQTTSILSRRRWESEWNNGHIPNATHIAGLQDFSGDAVPSQLLGCTACNIVLYCHSGYRSKQAADKLASLGFTGGIYDGLGIQQWQARCAHACTCSRHGQCPRLTVAARTMAGRRLPDRAHTVPRRPRLRASPRGLQLAAGAGAELPAQRARRRAAGEPCS